MLLYFAIAIFLFILKINKIKKIAIFGVLYM